MVHQTLHKIIGNNIRAHRKRLGYSQEKLAILAQLTPEHLGRIEGGYVNITIDSLLNISEALNFPVHFLLMEKPRRNTKKK